MGSRVTIRVKVVLKVFSGIEGRVFDQQSGQEHWKVVHRGGVQVTPRGGYRYTSGSGESWSCSKCVGLNMVTTGGWYNGLMLSGGGRWTQISTWKMTKVTESLFQRVCCIWLCAD